MTTTTQPTPGSHGKTVLVTGGSGYVGSWAVVKLLQTGYRVRTTVRQIEREGQVRAMVGGQVEPRHQDLLTFHEADLLRDRGWDAAVAGADYVLHVASPMPIGEYRKQDVITPAREGVRRVLEASLAGGVERVVLTSSTMAAIPQDASLPADETVWADPPDRKIYAYPRAKTLAEQDAWAFARAAGGKLELSTVLPGSIQGPVLGADYSASVDLVGLMLRGRMPATRRIGFGIVDVRDLVDLHILAMTRPEAAGERFVAIGDFLWFAEIAALLRAGLGPAAAKAPTRTLPDWVVRAGALVNPELAQLAPNLGVRRDMRSTKAEAVLGWRPRPARESVLDTARSLIDRGLV